MTKEDLISRGWHTYYNENYWVHPDLVEDPKAQDYTNYGVCFEDACMLELAGRPKHKSLGLPGLSILEMASRLKKDGLI